MRFTASAFILIACLSLTACGGSGSSEGLGSPASGGAYTSVNTDGLSFEFKSGGVVTMSAKAMNVTSSGTYTTDGDKLIVTMDGQPHTFVRDGKCIEEPRQIFGKLCQGGKAGEASNVSTRKPPVTEGTWVATNADGEFTIDFKPGNKLALTATMAGSGKSRTDEGTIVVDGDRLHVQLPGGTLVLKFVNNAYESTSFGLPMKFVRK
jgi:hypothetical protein